MYKTKYQLRNYRKKATFPFHCGISRDKSGEIAFEKPQWIAIELDSDTCGNTRNQERTVEYITLFFLSRSKIKLPAE